METGRTIKKRILKNGEIKYYTYNTDKEYNNKYYINNKNTLLNKIKCSCGGSYNSLSKSNHLKTKKHNKHILGNIS
jgi:hypothetical protein